MIPKMLWMEIDLKNKELPLRIADTARELAEMCGVAEISVRSAACRARRGTRQRFVTVWVADV